MNLRLTLAALGLVAGAGVAAMAWAPRIVDDPAPQAAGRVKPQVSGVRFAYPAGREPSLAFPDGRREPVRSLLNITTPMKFGDYVWNDAGVPKGKVWVRVDLDRQLISVFRSGHEIGTAVVLFGSDGTPTPTGLFPILEKHRDYHSRTYDAPMPFMMRLTNGGVALHASNVRQGSATHGCIGTPAGFASHLFAEMQVGDRVLIEQRAVPVA